MHIPQTTTDQLELMTFQEALKAAKAEKEAAEAPADAE